MIDYLLKIVLCSYLLWSLYRLILQSERMFRFNRAYLLACLLLPLCAPLLSLEIISVSQLESVYHLDQAFAHSGWLAKDDAGMISWSEIGWYVYLSGFMLFFTRFLIGISGIFRYRSAKLILGEDNINYRLVSGLDAPFVFLDTVYLNLEDYEEDKLDPMLLEHESVHVIERHSIDILLAEIIKVVFWFNPFFYLITRDIKLNHEFLADEYVLTGHDKSKYQEFLFGMLYPKYSQGALASNLNFLLTKKRIKMMTKQSSSVVVSIKKYTSIVLSCAIVLLFADYTYAQVEQDNDKQGFSINKPDPGPAPMPPHAPAPPSPVAAPPAPPAPAPNAPPLPPAPPEVSAETITRDALCFVNGKKSTRDKAIKVLEQDSRIKTVDVRLENGQKVLYITTQ